MDKCRIVRETLDKNYGIFRMVPCFVPRIFSTPGRRLRLHPDDYFALGTGRGAIKERWFTSMVKAKNGPLTAEFEGLSFVAYGQGENDKFLFRDAVEELGADLLGQQLYEKYGTWPMFAKFFDNEVPLFHHLHLSFKDAEQVGALGKPEAYFFPRQYNNHTGQMPVSYFGFDPSVSKGEVRERLLDFTIGDNRITELSRAFRLELGTGWYTPMGVVHAPGSLLTYEPQWNSDVNAVLENVASHQVYDRHYMVENLPDDKQENVDAVMDLLDWEANIDPDYRKTYFRPPVFFRGEEGIYTENWIVYGNSFVGGTELTILPGRSVILKDPVPYGCILVQGYGRFGTYQCETAGMLRFGQFSADEFFVSSAAAGAGVTIKNNSCCEPLVILKHFVGNYQNMP